MKYAWALIALFSLAGQAMAQTPAVLEASLKAERADLALFEAAAQKWGTQVFVQAAAAAQERSAILEGLYQGEAPAVAVKGMPGTTTLSAALEAAALRSEHAWQRYQEGWAAELQASAGSSLSAFVRSLSKQGVAYTPQALSAEDFSAATQAGQKADCGSKAGKGCGDKAGQGCQPKAGKGCGQGAGKKGGCCSGPKS